MSFKRWMVYEPTANTDGFTNQQPPQQISASTNSPFEPLEPQPKIGRNHPNQEATTPLPTRATPSQNRSNNRRHDRVRQDLTEKSLQTPEPDLRIDYLEQRTTVQEERRRWCRGWTSSPVVQEMGLFIVDWSFYCSCQGTLVSSI